MRGPGLLTGAVSLTEAAAFCARIGVAPDTTNMPAMRRERIWSGKFPVIFLNYRTVNQSTYTVPRRSRSFAGGTLGERVGKTPMLRFVNRTCITLFPGSHRHDLGRGGRRGCVRGGCRRGSRL